MFSIFRKIFRRKQYTLMDAMIHAIYGENPPAKSADVDRAVTIAHEDLLCGRVAVSEVRRIASALAAGPMPYSTHDLAIATALSFFKTSSHFDLLAEVQISARLRVLDWMTNGQVAPSVARIFEDALYRIYKPRVRAEGQN